MSYFDSAYRSYSAQNPPKKLDHYLDVITARLAVSTPRLLDVGCGRGLFLERAAQVFPDWRLSGLEVDDEGVAYARVLAPTADVRAGEATAMPFPSDSFDVITAWDVLEHIQDVKKALDEIKRSLRPGGLVALVVPVYDGITGPVIRLLDKDPTHVHKRSRYFWVDMIEAEFFQVEWHGIHRYLLTEGTYLHRPTQLLRRAAAAILISAINR